MSHRFMGDRPLAETLSGCRGEPHKSPSKRGSSHPLRETSLILAAHGDRGGRVSEALGKMARRVREEQVFAQVLTAFQQGRPRFSEILDLVSSRQAVVVPVFMAEGYYSRQVLPRELRSSFRRDLKVYTTPVVGVSDRLKAVLASRVGTCCKELNWREGETAAIVLGHGTPRSAGSRDTTLALVSHLDAGNLRSVLPAFLDDFPSPEQVFERLEASNYVVIPFLFGGGGHSAELAGLFHLNRMERRMSGVTGIDSRGRKVFIDRAAGGDPVMIEIICELASNPEVWSRLSPRGEGHAG